MSDHSPRFRAVNKPPIGPQSSIRSFATASPKCVLRSGAPIKVARIPAVKTQTLHTGEMMWLPLAAQPRLTVEDGPETHLVLISFKD